MNGDNTLRFYEDNAKEYVDSTVNLNMSNTYSVFEKYLKPDAHILDIGCGSGRDSKHFSEAGYRVTAIDASLELCKYAQKIIGAPVLNIDFNSINFKTVFDAAWACASLLHLPKANIEIVLKKISDSLKKNGILYASFKYGVEEREEKGKWYSDYTESDAFLLFSEKTNLKLCEFWISESVIPDRKEKWINFIAKKR